MSALRSVSRYFSVKASAVRCAAQWVSIASANKTRHLAGTLSSLTVRTLSRNANSNAYHFTAITDR